MVTYVASISQKIDCRCLRFENLLGFEEKSCSPHGCFGGQNCKQLRDQSEQIRTVFESLTYIYYLTDKSHSGSSPNFISSHTW